MSFNILDDPEAWGRIDTHAMQRIIFGFPEQLRDAWSKWPLKEKYCVSEKNDSWPLQVIIAGMGGSAIGGDLVAAASAAHLKFPLSVWRSYGLPEFAGPGTLLVVSSYSGNTAEALSAYEEGKKRGCKLAVVTSGGQLEQYARQDGISVYSLPQGYPPRGALAYSFQAMHTCLRDFNLVPDNRMDCEQASELLVALRKQYDPKVPYCSNIAKQIAGRLHCGYPIIYTEATRMAVAAVRWRGQLAENAKMLSSHHLIPEMNHNEIVGYRYPENVLESVVVVFLRDSDEGSQVAGRMEATAELLRSHVRDVIQCHSSGDSLLSRLLSLIFLGDCVSYFSAILNAVDPYPVDMIDTLKMKLST
jgi:glucose/mannose-6-phosphate isomerase